LAFELKLSIFFSISEKDKSSNFLLCEKTKRLIKNNENNTIFFTIIAFTTFSNDFHAIIRKNKSHKTNIYMKRLVLKKYLNQIKKLMKKLNLQ
jgi:hypothetical protein